MRLGQGLDGEERGYFTMRSLLSTLAVFVLVLSACSADVASPGADRVSEPSGLDSDRQPSSATTVSEAGPTCDIPDGQPLNVGPEVELAELGRSGDILVRGAVYPHPDYEGRPWSQWGQGMVTDDGRLFSAIGDHIGTDGNSYIYEYDPDTGVLRMVADVLSFVDHSTGSWGYGKIHGQMVEGPCGEIYLSTYWGTFRGLEFGGSYTGDLMMRLDPYGESLAPLEVPVDRHGQASLAASSAHGLVYGEAVDPILKAEGENKGPFFVYDVESEEVIFENDASHVGYRNILVDGDGVAYFSLGQGRLAVYDPETNGLETHGELLPGDWVRASTAPTADGRVFGVTREPDRFFVMEPTGEIVDLGEARGYTTTMAVGPDGDYFYYLPYAHGNAWKSGAPLIRVDGSTGTQDVILELSPIVEQSLGYRVGGTYSIAISADGSTLYIGANVASLEDDSGFGEVVLLVIDLP